MEPIKVWDLPITDGAILREHIPYASHRRGKNWLAVIRRDPKAPGGLARDFFERGHGEYAYVISDIPEGSALECGADYYTGGGHPDRKRYYYLLLKKTPTAWTLASYESASNLFAAQKEYVPPSGKTRLITLGPEKGEVNAQL